MTETIRIAVFRLNAPVSFETIPNELEDMSGIVGGYIEVLPIGGGLILTCNEDGKRYQLAPTSTLLRSGIVDNVVGTFFVARKDGDEYASIKPADEARLTAWTPGGVWTVE